TPRPSYRGRRSRGRPRDRAATELGSTVYEAILTRSDLAGPRLSAPSGRRDLQERDSRGRRAADVAGLLAADDPRCGLLAKAGSPQTPYTCGVCSCCGRFVAPGPRTDVSGKAGVTHLVLPGGQAAQRLEAGTGSASGGDGRHWCSRSVTARSSDSPYGQPESAARMASWSARVSRTIVRPCRRAVSSASAVPSSPRDPSIRP